MSAARRSRRTRRRPPAPPADADTLAQVAPLVIVLRKHVGRLQTVADWHRQLGKVYREMRRGDIPLEDGTRLVYAVTHGAKLSHYLEELRKLATIEQRLTALLERQGAQPMLAQHLPSIAFAAANLDGSTPHQSE